MSRKSRSPLKRRPLRTAGQSVQDRIWDVLMDRVMVPWIVAILLGTMAVMEVVRAYMDSPPTPRLSIALALVAVGFALWRTRKTMKEVRSLKLARDGERAVGQFLEGLRKDGFSVFHDLQGEGFNVDHVVIGPKGVFTIETKTWSKSESVDARIEFNGEELRAAGWLPQRDPITQAKAQARWVGDLLEESTGRKFFVKPVIVFPGWFVEQVKGTHRDIWVLNPKGLPAFLGHEPDRVSPEDVALAGSHLSKSIRARESIGA